MVRPHLFFDRVDGTLADEVPDRFSDLEDNPVRELVAKARAKVRPRGDGALDLSVKRLAVWVKGPDAPAFVEFHVAKIVREALNSAGRPYDGLRSVTPLDEEIMRDALLRAEADPRHPSRHVLDRIVVVPRDLRDRLQLRAALRLDPDTHAVRIDATAEPRRLGLAGPYLTLPSIHPTAAPPSSQLHRHHERIDERRR